MRFLVRALASVVMLAANGVRADTGAAAPVADALGELVYAGSAQDFVAAHGERALVMGYPDGLEVWAYPLQLLSGYRPRFRVAGQVASIDGALLLRRVEHHPTEVVRVYVGPDFVVREHLFVPRQAAAAIIRYEVEGRPEVGIEIAFRPALDLMWPGALGGQTIGWDDALSAYVEREPLHGFAAIIASPETIGHDEIVNRTRPAASDIRLLLMPRATAGAVRTATLYVAAKPQSLVGPADLRAWQTNLASSEADARAHVAEVRAQALQIVTPDVDVNRALASAVVALDAAWVCSDALGCGEVAGYGPSRPGRRPQYAWFFAGDGLVAMQAMLAAGQYTRARDELLFVTRYQNARTGMIWHELSQSAPLIGWEKNYPYMFVHVDITFQYLVAVEDYVQTTGDTRFLAEHWRGIEAAYRYCLSTLGATGLPEIPADKEGQNEQDRLRDDIRLSTLWIDAAGAFARLAQTAGHPGQAVAASAKADRARHALGAHGWDEARDFWLSGHTLTGEPVHSERPDASGVLLQGVFAQTRIDSVLDRIASPEFQTDWGTRSLSANAHGYDPNLYGSGSVWALGTASVAATFWKAHRPLSAWGLWRALVPWNTLDSAGHLHEVLAGDAFRPEMESVPEQTWSSAALLDAAVRGWLGIQVRAAEHRLAFAPHVPDDWRMVTVRNVIIGTAPLTLSLTRDDRALCLQVENRGDAITVDFNPALPLGARLTGAWVDGARAEFGAEHHPQDDHARLRFVAKPGSTSVRLDIAGGIDIRVGNTTPAIGDADRGLKIVGARYADGVLDVDAWVTSPERTSFTITTQWRPERVEGARIDALGGSAYRIIFQVGENRLRGGRGHAVIHFAR